MAHFAELNENNEVIRVIVVHNNELMDENNFEVEKLGIIFCQKLLGGRWIQTSYNKKIRKNFAGIGFKYDENLDAFIAPKPFESWILNEDSCQWEAPKPLPNNEELFIWDEDKGDWVNGETL